MTLSGAPTRISGAVVALIAGAALLVGCSSPQAGSAVTGAPSSSVGLPTGSSEAPTPSPAPSEVAQPTGDSASTEVPGSSEAVTSPEIPTTSAPPPSSTVGTPVQAINPECSDYTELVLFFEIEEGLTSDYRWWLRLYPGQPGKFELESGNTQKSWGYDVPVDLQRDVALCDEIAGKATGSGDPVDHQWAFVEITLAGGDHGRSAMNDDLVAGFEDMVLDRLPADLLQKIRSDFADWEASQSSASTDPGEPATAGTEPPTSSDAGEPGNPCATMRHLVVSFHNGETDPATFYEWKLTISDSANIMLISVGAPTETGTEGGTEGVNFQLSAELRDELCRKVWAAATAGEPTGTDGPAASVSIVGASNGQAASSGVAEPSALQDLVLQYVPKESWDVLWAYYTEWASSQGG